MGNAWPTMRLEGVLLALMAAGGCAHAPIVPLDARCQGGLEGARRAFPTEMGEAMEGVAANVVVEGAEATPLDLLRRVIELQPGDAIDADVIQGDTRRIMELAAYEHVVVHADANAGGITVRYEVFERPLVGEVLVVGDAERPLRTRGLEGDVYSPARIHRMSQRFRDDLVRDGYSEARVRAHAWRGEGDRVGVCFAVDAGRIGRIGRLDISGHEHMGEDAIIKVLDSHDGRANVPGGVYREDLLRDALLRLSALYMERGLIEFAAEEPVVTWDEGELNIAIRLREGRVFRVGSISIVGSRASGEEHRRLNDLRTGAVFVRSRVVAVLERMKALEASRGGTEAEWHQEATYRGDLVDIDILIGEQEEGMSTSTEATEYEPSLGIDALQLDPGLAP